MRATAKWRGVGRGLMEQCYIVRCADCRAKHEIGARDGVLDVGLAAQWAREAGWSLGGDQVWRCPEHRRAKRKVKLSV